MNARGCRDLNPNASMGPRYLSAVALLLLSSAVAAGESDRRELDAHEHGHGLLTVAVDGSDLVIELEMPAVNVVGFEHAPKTDEQRHAVEEALDTFGRGGALFVPTADAGCLIEKAEVALAGMSREGSAEEGHGHAEKHAEKHGEEHAEEHEGESHSELHGEYHFHCDQPGKLESLEVRLFDHLRDVEELDVQVVTPTVQTATELRRATGVISLAAD